MRVFKAAWFERFARKERITDEMIRDAVRRAERGLIDAELGGGLIKQRVARPGSGRSGGYRTIVLFRAESRAVFVFGFAKNDRANLRPDEVEVFKRAARLTLGFTDAEMNAEVLAQRLIEVDYDEDPQE